MMHEHGQSDRHVVRTKPPNNGPKRPAEAVEGRRLTKGNLRQPTRFRTPRRVRMSHALERVRHAASRDRTRRFTALLHHVYRLETLRRAYDGVNPQAVPGVDGRTGQQDGEELETHLQALADRLVRGAYRAQPTRRTSSPKADGRQRPLGVTALEDTIVQAALVAVLHAIYAVDFRGLSYGSRPGRRPHDALDALTVALERSKVHWVLKIAMRGLFDAMVHAWLERFLAHRIADRRIVRRIRQWWQAGVREDGTHRPSAMGSPQGASFSPLAATISLHDVCDVWAHQWRHRHCQGAVRLVRDVDAIVVGFEHRQEAEQFQDALRQRLATCGLELHPEKTRVMAFGRVARTWRLTRGLGKPETLTLLGFTHVCRQSRQGGYQVMRRTMAQRVRAKLAESKAELGRRTHQSVPLQGAWLRSVLVGH